MIKDLIICLTVIVFCVATVIITFRDREENVF